MINPHLTSNNLVFDSIQNRIVCSMHPSSRSCFTVGWSGEEICQRQSISQRGYVCDGTRRWITAEETQKKGGRTRGGPEKEGIRRTEQVQTRRRKTFKNVAYFWSSCVECFGHTLLILSHFSLRRGCWTSWRGNEIIQLNQISSPTPSKHRHLSVYDQAPLKRSSHTALKWSRSTKALF